jgi:peroxiredoxin
MATASDTGNPPRPLAPQLRVGDEIPVFSLPDTSGVSVSSTVLLEPSPLIITFTFEVQSRGGSLAAIARETAPNSNRRFQQQHRVDFPILNDATAAVALSFGIGWTEAYLQSLYDQFVADRTGDSPEPSWIEPMQARYVVARDGTIAYVDINTDYRVAPELAAAMAALRRL